MELVYSHIGRPLSLKLKTVFGTISENRGPRLWHRNVICSLGRVSTHLWNTACYMMGFEGMNLGFEILRHL